MALEREVVTFVSANIAEQGALPLRTQLIALGTGSFSAEDGVCSLSLLNEEVSPIGSVATKRAMSQQVGSASTMPNPPR